jgi:hypothetical protein
MSASTKKKGYTLMLNNFNISSDEEISRNMCMQSSEAAHEKAVRAREFFDQIKIEEQKKAIDGSFSDFYEYFDQKSIWNMFKEVYQYRKKKHNDNIFTAKNK